nr:MAG TPA: hypothetical protein [Bacteriophage sp.]
MTRKSHSYFIYHRGEKGGHKIIHLMTSMIYC